MMEPQAKTMKKKKSRLFETYIPKVLKQISEGSGITSNAKQQLNSALCIIARSISESVITLTKFSKKKTLFEKEVYSSLRVIIPDSEIANNAVIEGQNAIIKFKETNKEKHNGSSRQNKAGIIFPPSIAEKFLRDFDYSNIMVNKSAPICFAAALEYITAELLELAVIVAKDNKRVRITIRDMELGVRQDNGMDRLFKKLNLSFIGGGVTPFVHESLIVKKTRKKRTTKVSEVGVKKPHRFRPGTVSLREIRKYQKMYNSLTFAKSPFEKIIRNITTTKSDSDNKIKISKDVFVVLQYHIEQYLVTLLKSANFAAIHAGRVKLIPLDIEFVSAVKNNSLNPYEASIKNSKICSIDDYSGEEGTLKEEEKYEEDNHDDDAEEEESEDELEDVEK
jgi:histone H3